MTAGEAPVFDLAAYRLERRPTGPVVIGADPPDPDLGWWVCPACHHRAERHTSSVSARYCTGGHRGIGRHPFTACEAVT